VEHGNFFRTPCSAMKMYKNVLHIYPHDPESSGKLSKNFMNYQGRHEVRWRPVKEASLAPHVRTWGLSEANAVYWRKTLLALLGAREAGAVWYPETFAKPSLQHFAKRWGPDGCYIKQEWLGFTSMQSLGVTHFLDSVPVERLLLRNVWEH